MKKFMTKVLSAFLCIAFTGLQMSFADVLTSGMFADKSVLTGAQIKGHTAGLTKVDTDAALNNATLHFNNNTRIDWTNLNVYKGQSLYFKNGNFGVLNNVVGTSISKFAGLVKADNGKIIISNPNGILFQGGQFESLGGLVLTTKNLTDVIVDETTNFDNIDYDLASYGDNFSVVAITESSNIASADINIISQGILVDSSTLSSSDANGIVLSTTDGSNFIASVPMTSLDGETKTVKFNSGSVKYPLSIANSALSAENGTVKLTSENAMVLSKADITGNLNAKATDSVYSIDGGSVSGNATYSSKNGIVLLNYGNYDTLKIGKDLNVSATNQTARIRNIEVGGNALISSGATYLFYSTVNGNTTITDTAKNDDGIWVYNSNLYGMNSINGLDSDMVALSTVNAGSTIVTATSDFVRVFNSNFDGDLTINAFSVNLGDYTNAVVTAGGKTTVNGDLTIKSKSTVGYSDTVTADNITITTDTSSILQAKSDTSNGKLISKGDLNLTAEKGKIAGLDSTTKEGGSDYYRVMTNQGNIGEMTTEKMANYDTLAVDLQAKKANISSDGSFAATATVSGDMTIKTNDSVYMRGTVGGTLKADADNFIGITGVEAGNLNLTSTYIFVNKSAVKGNSIFTDNVDDGNGISVYNSSLTGTNTFNGNDAIIIDGVSAGKTTISNAGDFVRVHNSSFSDDLDITANSVSLGSYTKGATLAADGSVNVNGALKIDSVSTVGYSDTVTADSINIKSQQSSIVQADSDNVKGKLVSDDITLTAQNGYVIPIDGNVVDNSSEYYRVMNGNLTKTGTLNKAEYETVLGKSADEAGAIQVETKTQDGDLKLTMDTDLINVDATAENVTLNVPNPTQNITLTSNGNISLSDATVTKPSGATDDVRGNVNLTSENGSVTIGNVKADTNIVVDAQNGTITAGGLVADAEQNGVGDIILNAGGAVNVGDTISGASSGANVAINSGTDAIVKNVSGEDDVTISAMDSVVADNVFADTNNDMVGKLTISAGDNATVSNASGKDVEITAENDVKVSDTTAKDDVIVTATNGSIDADRLAADTNNDGIGDIILNAGKGNVDLNGASGENIKTTSGGTTNVEDAKATNDVIINSVGDVIVNKVIADSDENGKGDLIINGNKNVTVGDSSGNNVGITSGVDAIVNNVTGADDVIITAGGNVTVENAIADGNNDGIGDLIINGNGNIGITGGSGHNVDINGNGENSDVTVKDITASNDVTIDAGHDATAENVKGDNDVIINTGNDFTGSDLIADADNNGKGDLIINGNGNVGVTGGSGENVEIKGNGQDSDVTVKDITAGNDVKIDAGHDGNAENVKGENDVIINTGNDFTGKDLVADSDGDGKGDLIINGNGNIDITGGSGENVDINGNGENSDVTVKDITAGNDVTIDAGHDGNAENVKGENDVIINTGNDFTGKDLEADSDNDGKGDLIINGGNNVDVSGGSGNNVDIDSGKDTTANDINAKDDIYIDAGGNVDADDLTADTNNDGIGDIYINAGGTADVSGATGNRVVINAPTVIFNGVDISDSSLSAEVLKNLNNLSQSGVNTAIAQSFTPIAFAASDDDEEQSILAKKIAKTVFRTEDGTVSITDRFDALK